MTNFCSTKSIFIFALFSCLAPASIYSTNHWETTMSASFNNMTDIDHSSDLSSYRLALKYFFYNYKSNQSLDPMVELGVDLSIMAIKTSKSADDVNNREFAKNMAVISPAFLARWYPMESIKSNSKKSTKSRPSFMPYFMPYIEAGIGPGYNTNSEVNFEGRDMGSHFLFQDIAGVGIKTDWPFNNELILGVYISHYSNANLYEGNRGVTIPMLFQIGYRF